MRVLNFPAKSHRPRPGLRARLLAMGLTAGLAAFATLPATAQDMEEGGPPACYLPESEQEDGTVARSPTPDALEDAYDCLEGWLLDSYAQSKHVVPALIEDWERASYAPFKMEQIADRYLVIYGNERAVGEEETVWLDRDMPIGAIVAAAGFTIDGEGRAIPAPLFIYEKMSNGYLFGRGNWRQTLIEPDGTIAAVTKGPGAEQLTACADCGARAADRMYLALLNDGRVPADAPEAGPPITDNELDAGGETLDPGALLAPPPSDAPLDPLSPSEPPASQSLDPNATLQPLDPLAPLDPGTPLDPNQPVDPLLDPNAPLDPLAPLDPNETSDASPMLEPDTALDPAPDSMEEETAMIDPALSDSTGSAEDDLGRDSMGEEDMTASVPTDPQADIQVQDLSGLALELEQADDPLLLVPNIAITDPPPPLEPADET